MLLQKTSWRLKQLVSSRRTHSFEYPNGYLNPNDMARAAAAVDMSPRSKSALESRRSQEDYVLFRSNSPVETSRTPRRRWVGCMDAASSSTSSLCSCESCEPMMKSTASSQTKNPSLEWKARHNSQTSDNSSGSVTLIIQTDGAASPVKCNKDRSRTPTPELQEEEEESVFDLLEALASGSDYRSRSPTTPPLPPPQESPVPEHSFTPSRSPSFESIEDPTTEDVERLIDDAFEAIGNPFGENRTTWDEISQVPFKISPTIPIPPSLKKKSSKPSLAREASSKAARRKSTTRRRRKMLGRHRDSPSKSAQKETPTKGRKWHVTENVAGIFQVFKDIEVDEMLTEERKKKVEEEREKERERIAKLEAEKAERVEDASSPATLNMLDKTPPADPFHPKDLSHLNTPEPSPHASSPLLRRSLDETASRKGSSASIDSVLARRSLDDGRGLPKGLGIQPPPLPSIPESQRISRISQKTRRTDPCDSELYLPSTPYSQISPRFRHGSIRVSKTERLRNDDLDWTALQIAISGGLGDYMMESFSLTDEIEEKEIDELTSWWDDFGLGGCGDLLDTGLPGEEEEAYNYDSDVKHSPSQFSDVEAPGIELYAEDNEPHVKSSRQSLESAPEEHIRDDDDESLPPSPMVQLIGDEDEIPMGFNLSHDLEDFLKWNNHLDGFSVLA